jgi:hypothetical protein
MRWRGSWRREEGEEKKKTGGIGKKEEGTKRIRGRGKVEQYKRG